MTIFRIVLIGLLICLPAALSAKVHIVASLTDFGSIAADIGGARVEVSALAKPSSDPHAVEVLPSYMMKVAKADLYLQVGLGLDGWAQEIIQGARNPNLVLVDCSAGISVLDKPNKAVDASMGDVHPQGNPHYWLNPENAIPIAATITAALCRADPGGASIYQANESRWEGELKNRIAAWKEKAKNSAGGNIITYHSSWPYLAEFLNLTVVGTVEPLPGIPPSASHLSKLVNLVKSKNVRVVLKEPYFSTDATALLARESGVRIVEMASSCPGPTAGSYIAHMQEIIDHIEER